jgi:hypothetical protein
MSRHEEMRSRFHRISSPRFSPDDLTRLFLWLREPERPIRPATIREIGDFVAHADTREKGPVTYELRDFLFHARMMHRLGPNIELTNLPTDFVPTVRRNFERLPKDLILLETGLKRRDAKQALETILSNFHRTPNGGFTYGLNTVARSEITVLTCVLQHYDVKAVFTADDVTREFFTAAQRSMLIERTDKQAQQRMKPILAMFSMQSMHRTTIVLEDQWRATLNAGTYEGELAVFASAVVQTHEPGGRLGIRVPIFTTGLNANEWCDESLEVGPYIVWETPIELSADKKLVTLESPASGPRTE